MFLKVLINGNEYKLTLRSFLNKVLDLENGRNPSSLQGFSGYTRADHVHSTSIRSALQICPQAKRVQATKEVTYPLLDIRFLKTLRITSRTDKKCLMTGKTT
jgi:hypothetical protein